MDKKTLDHILEKHKAQPAGNGYIDIIVSRENYKPFVADLIQNEFNIRSISWWEWCPADKESEYGLGGPASQYFKGWFSELPVDVDDIESIETKEGRLEKVLNTIESKSISFVDKTVTFNESHWLTPAIWIEVGMNDKPSSRN